MAHRIYTLKGAIADGDFDLKAKLGELMSEAFYYGFISVTMYTNASMDTPVNPSAGTLTIIASEDNFNWGSLPDNVIDLTNPAYNRIGFAAPLTNIRGTFTGVVGATHYEVRVWRATT